MSRHFAFLIFSVLYTFILFYSDQIYTYVYNLKLGFCTTKKVHKIIISLAQIPIPESVTKRWGHSMTSFTVSVNCVWLLITGGLKTEGGPINGSNTVMIVELGKKNTSQLHITVYSQFSSSSTTLTFIIMDRIIVISKFTYFDRYIFDHSVCECNSHFDHRFKLL